MSELSIAAQAWNNTKADGDPEFGASAEPEFWAKLEFAAKKAIETGTAITNFEKEVQRLDALEKESHVGAGEPLAVVEEPAAITVGDGLTEKPDDKKPEKSESAKKSEKAKDQSVPKGKEAASTVKEQANAPKHP